MTAPADTLVGKPINRVDGRAKVTGAALFAADHPIPDALHAVMVTSTIASGRIVLVDDAVARTMPGIVAVLTPANAERLPDGGKAAVDPPAGRALTLLQDDVVHYNGQPVAVVVADTLEHAKAAADAVRMRYMADTPKLDFSGSLASAYPPKSIMGKQPAIRN